MRIAIACIRDPLLRKTTLSLQCRYLKTWLKITCSWRLTLWRYIHGISVFSVPIKIRVVLRGLKEVVSYEIYLNLGFKMLNSFDCTLNPFSTIYCFRRNPKNLYAGTDLVLIFCTIYVV